ncbi:MAG: PAS domain S-box protein, partial [Blastocatellia bacterium]|nr:PAS domain S-box protein [Blastocatellia bacterium]
MTSLKLLNVEDVEADTELVVLQLERSGYQVDCSRVETADQMREMLRSRTWDVIISDYSLPAFSGLDAFEILKDSGLDIPFIIISGTIGEEAAVAAMKAGVSDYLMKNNLGKIGPTIAREIADAEVRKAKHLAEGALAESEEDFRGLVLATTQHVWEMDENGKHAELPQWWLDLTGQSVDQSGDFGWLESVHPEDRDSAKHTFLHALESQTQVSLQLRIKSAAGTYRYFAARGVPLQRPDGTFRKWICTLADISERMQALDELRRSEERFRGLVEASSQFVWTADADGRGDELFKWLSELCGSEVRSFADIKKVLHEADRSTIWPMWTDALRDQKPYQFICRLQDKHHGYKHFDFRGNPIYNDTGSFREWVGTLSDVTDKFAAIDALERSEIHLRTIVEGSPECIKLLSRDIRILEMNKTGLDMIEAESVDDLIGREAIELVAPECRDDFRAIVQQVFEGGNGRLEFEIVSLKGTRRWLEMHAAPLRDRSGDIQSLLGLSRDVTNRRKTNEALKKSEARFRELFENANDLVYTHDLDGRFTSLNRAGEAITGYTREEALKMSITDVVAPESIALAKEKTDEKIAGQSATSYETEIIHKDGRRVTLDLSTRLIYEDGVAIG